MATFNLGTDGTYTSFSGADAIATFAGTVIGELQAITVNTQREKGPIYVLGSADPLSFSRGKRGVAGNLVFITFDQDALLTAMEANARQFGTIPQYTAAGNVGPATGVNAVSTNLVTQAGNYSGLPLNAPNNSAYNQLSTIVQFNAQTNLNVTDGNGTPFIQLHGQQAGEFWAYEDQIPPFDITVTLANEYGNAANLIINKVEILNEGMGISIDDINLERACTFIARGVQRIRPGFVTNGTANSSAPIGQSFSGTTTSNTPFVAT